MCIKQCLLVNNLIFLIYTFVIYVYCVSAQLDFEKYTTGIAEFCSYSRNTLILTVS